ncbi:MAG: DNA cytosine methyltransferase [Planctomycetaceae bacterium]
MRPVCAVEFDPYCREVLLRRQDEGHLPPFPVWDDATTFDGEPWRGMVDVITAGFPCQPFSAAGKQLGEADPRNMWPATIRIIREVGPTFCLLENVPGLMRSPYFKTILGQIADAGFHAEWDVISAAECGAPHIRKRLWILAYSVSERPSNQSRPVRSRQQDTSRGGPVSDANRQRREPRRRDNTGDERDKPTAVHSNMADAPIVGLDTGQLPKRSQLAITKPCSRGDASDAHREGLERRSQINGQSGRSEANADGSQLPTERLSWWQTEPELGRVADGVAYRVDRLRAIGNGQVPSVVVRAWQRLMSRRVLYG